MPKEKTELIITEKPAAAAKIAAALGKAEKRNLGKVPYYEIKEKGKRILIGCAVGHLFTLSQKEKKSGWPIFNIEWQPNFKVRKEDWSKKYYTALSQLCKEADSFIVACDYDTEGEVIGWNVLRFICKKETAKRMKFSTLTAPELKASYSKVLKELNFGQAYAGETRHKLDWLYGINLSRALMEAIKKAGSFKILSIGRVQGPALHLVVNKEKQIRAFKSTPYWQVYLLVSNSHKVEVKYPKDITKKTELAKFKILRGKEGEARTIKKEQEILPPSPFDLTTLQTEVYKFHNFSPSRTLQIAQQLYLAGLISYPRTSSQKLPPSISYKEILKKLSKQTSLVKYATREKPIEGKKSDPAHPSIYPTGEGASLKEEEKKIYDLIIRRFISCFCESAVLENKKIEVAVDSLKFIAKGLTVKEKGWINVYKAKMKEIKLPDLNGRVRIKEIRTEEKQTQPPKRFTPASLVRELEKRNLGTKATRSSVIETLYNRDYIKEKSIEATTLGISLVGSLEKNSPVIIDENLTREFEKQMTSIQTAKKNLKQKSEKIIKDAEKTLLKIEKQFKKNENKIGKILAKAVGDVREQERKENTLNKCPKCGKGNLRILFNRKSRRYFVACDAYPKCKNTFSLPPNSLIKPAGEICEHCKFLLLLAIRKGKRPWIFCFNPECPSRKKYNQKKA
jgi:DNA topoisomerase-1